MRIQNKVVLAVIAVLLSLMTVVSAFGASEGSVYADPEEREYVYTCTQQEKFWSAMEFNGIRVSIIKESVTPVYTVELLGFAATDELAIDPLLWPEAEPSQQQIFTAKMITENNEYAGNVMFYVEDGEAHFLNATLSAAFKEAFDAEGSTDSVFPNSYSYADHASRIASLLNSGEMISPEDVRFVMLDRLGGCFYVLKDGVEYFIPVGVTAPDRPYIEKDRIVTRGELREIALDFEKDYNDRQKAKEEWEKEHPGEKWLGIGSGMTGSDIESGCSRVDNIIEIDKYFSENIKSNEQEPDAEPIPGDSANASNEQRPASDANSDNRSIYRFIVPAALLIAVVIIAGTAFIGNKKKQERA